MELLPREQIAFQRMLDTIRRNYERFGFLPVETPVFELSEVLLTKTGGETERQVYFVQSTGALANASESAGGQPELALRFDLTVPLARYVAQHEHDLAFPFRRYQIQRVYRGERAQRGRFREFYQCDIDVIGKDALSVRHDAEMPAVIHAVFSELEVGPFTIQLNNRKLLRGFFEGVGIADGERQALVLREIDKIDKRGADAVRATLVGADFGLANDVVDRIMAFVQVRSTSHADALARLAALGEGIDRMRDDTRERIQAERDRLIRADESPCQLHNNCSGKHSGFLTVTKHMKAGPEYVELDHPLQKAVKASFEEVTGETSAGYGIDGCSAPNFACSVQTAGSARVSPLSVPGPKASQGSLLRVSTTAITFSQTVSLRKIEASCGR